MTSICQNMKIIFLIIGMNNVFTLKTIDRDGYCISENVTVKTTNGTVAVTSKLYCCRHYEKQNNTCKECKIGYISDKGQPCQQCSDGSYGNRCAFVCKCQDNERCDHVQGCLAMDAVSVTSPVSIIKEQNLLSRAISNQQLLYIMFVICFGLLFGLVFVIWKYKKKSQSTQISTPTKDCNRNGNSKFSLKMQDQNTTGNFDSQSDEIDESFMTLREQNVKEPSTSTTIIDESVSLTCNNRAEHHAVSSDYLTPISSNDDNRIICDNQDTDVISEVEIPECRRRPKSAVSDYLIPVNAYNDSNVSLHDSSHTSNDHSDDYLHPYTSLINTLQKDAVTADIHKDDQVANESGEEDNDHKYSHLYEQLRHDLTDRCPMFMLQPFPLQQNNSDGTNENNSKQNTEILNTIPTDEEEKKGTSCFYEMSSFNDKVPLPVEEKKMTAKDLLTE